MLELKNVSKVYQTKYEEVLALNNINLKFTHSSLVFILGKSGCGKSTLLNILGGIDTPTSGDILINDEPIKNVDAYRKTTVGFIFQEPNLIDNLTVYENIKISLDFLNIPDHGQIAELLSKLDLTPLKDKLASSLSGGEKARVGIARSLIKNPSIILADEPTGNLDDATSQIIYQILREEARHKLVIVVSHDTIGANKYAEEIIYLKDGQITDITKLKEASQDLQINQSPATKISLKTLLKASRKLLTAKKKIFGSSIILLSLLFTCLGFCLVLNNFDLNKSQAEALVANEEYTITLLKESGYTDFNVFFTNTQLATIQLGLTGYNYDYTYNLYINNNFNMFNFVSSNRSDVYQFFDYASPSVYLYVPLNDRFNYEYIGTIPKENDEIMVSSYLAQYIIRLGIYDEFNNPYYPTSYEELLQNNTIIINEQTYKITAIYLLDEELMTKDFLTLEEEDHLLNNLYIIYADNSFFTKTYPENAVEESFIMSYLNDYYTSLNTLDTLNIDEIILSYDMASTLDNPEEVELTITSLYDLFPDKKQTLKVVALEDTTSINPALLKDYIFPNYLVRYINIYEEEATKIQQVLETYSEGDIIYQTKYSADFQEIAKSISSIEEFSIKLSFILLLFIIIVMILYYNISLKHKEKTLWVFMVLGMSPKEVKKTIFYENIFFSFLVFVLSAIILNINIIIGNIIISNSFGYQVALLLNNSLIYGVVFLVLTIMIIGENILNKHILK